MRNLLVQVNLLRRADECFRELAAGRMVELIGRLQAAQGLYGNGLINNGTHMVDLVRMLFGEVEEAKAVNATAGFVLPLARRRRISA